MKPNDKKDVHIGEAILEKLKKSGMTNVEFGRKINKSPQNVTHLTKRQSIDSKLLFTISKVLDFNFFTLYYAGTPDQKPDPLELINKALQEILIKIDKLGQAQEPTDNKLKEKIKVAHPRKAKK